MFVWRVASRCAGTRGTRKCHKPAAAMDRWHSSPSNSAGSSTSQRGHDTTDFSQWLRDSASSAANQGSAVVQGLWEAAQHAAQRLSDAASSAPGRDWLDGKLTKGQSKAEEWAAQWRWSGRRLTSGVRLPLSTEVDERLLFTCALAVLQYLSSCGEGAAVDEQGRPQPSLLLPPTTMYLTLACVGIFFKPGGVLLNEVCLSPYCVVQKKEWARLLLAAVVHVDAAHLLSNLSTAVPECAVMERRVGSPRMALELLSLTTVSHGLYVGWTIVEKRVFSRSAPYYAVGAVGLSSLAFAVQVANGAKSSEQAYLAFLPLAIPRKYIWAVHVLLSHLAAPDSSLAGHMCGVAAGLIHGYILTPVMRLLTGGIAPASEQGRGQVWGSGTWGGRRIGAGAPVGRGRRWWQSPVWRCAKELAVQVALAAATVGACVLLNAQRPNRRPIALWPMTGSGRS